MNEGTLIGRNLFRKKLRALLMMVSIFIAFAIFGVLASFQRAFSAGEDLAMVNRLVVVNKINFTQPLPYAYYNRVRGVDGVHQVTHMNWFGGYYQDPKNFMVVMAVEPQSYLDVYASDLVVSPQMRADFIRERTGALVGEAMARRWGWKVGDRVPVNSSIFTNKKGGHTWEMTVVGIVGSTTPRIDTDFMVFQYAYFDETRTFSRDTVGWLALNTTSPAVNERVIKTIDQMFANSSYETATDTEKAFNKAFAAQLGNIALIVELVVGAAFVTILLIVGNTMTMAVRERTREIAVLKTLGFGRGRIIRLVLGESVLLAALGGVPGLAGAGLFTWVVSAKLGSFLPGFAMTPLIIAEGVALMLGFGVVTGLIPALNAMRLDIATGLGRG
jgi:putative ABC transport system permease protein